MDGVSVGSVVVDQIGLDGGLIGLIPNEGVGRLR